MENYQNQANILRALTHPVCLQILKALDMYSSQYSGLMMLTSRSRQAAIQAQMESYLLKLDGSQLSR
jgi:hypothetical protein